MLSLPLVMVIAVVASQAAPAAPAPDGPERVTFAEVVQRAMARNSSAAIAVQEIRRAEGLLAEARSGSLPLLTATGAVLRLDADRVQPGSGSVAAAKNQQSANVSLSVPLVAPARWAQWVHGADNVDVASVSEADVRRTVALTAARAYLGVLTQKRIIDVSLRARNTARAHFEFSHGRRAGGVGNAIDEARAEQQLAVTESQLERAYAALVSAQEALGTTIGSELPADAADEPVLSEAPSPDLAQGDAEPDRSDLKLARARAHAALRVAKDSWTDWLPTLLGSAQIFYQHPPTVTTPEHGWQAQLVLSLPIFEGGLRAGQLKERKALSAEADLQLEALLRQARSEVRLGYDGVKRGEAALVSARLAANRANLVLDLTTRAYRAGAANSLDVVDAERQAQDADTTAVQAEDAVRQARLNLLAATGHFP